MQVDGVSKPGQGESLPFERSYRFPAWGADQDFLLGLIQSVTGTAFYPSDAFEVYRYIGTVRLGRLLLRPLLRHLYKTFVP